MGDTEEFKSLSSMKNSSSRAEWCVCWNGFWALWGIFYLDRHFRSWNLVQEVVSEALLNNVVNSILMRKICTIFSLLFYGSSGYFNMCAYLFTQKNWSQRIEVSWKQVAQKGAQKQLVVGEGSSWVCILLDMKESPPSIWQQMHQNWLLRDESIWNWLCKSCFSCSCWDYSGV